MAKKLSRKAVLWVVIAVLFLIALFLVVQAASFGNVSHMASDTAQSAYSMVGSC